MNGEHTDIEATILEMFEENYGRLSAESGHAISPDLREAAWQQVLMYWRKLRDLAESITDTEVKLNLSNQTTPKGRRFCIEGIVDIVREADRTTMYDIKTHDLPFIRANLDFYQKQLNVYAHIWQNLRGERLDETAVISTPVPEPVRRAVATGDPAALEKALAGWNPVVPIPFDARNVEETVRQFAETVDAIEDGKFCCPPTEALARRNGRRDTLGARVCSSCDARFSCGSYREYARVPRRRDSTRFAGFYGTLDSEEAQENWRQAGSASGSVADALGDV